MSNTDFDRLSSLFNQKEFIALNEELSFSEYIERVRANPRLARNAWQRMYDMILSKGTETFERYRKTYIHYNFFDDAECPIFDHEEMLNELVKVFKGGAGGYGTERRVLLLLGPVGSSKSSLCRALKRGMEKYSREDQGAWYTYKWVDLPTGDDGIYTHAEDMCAMRDDPLKLIPQDIRNVFLQELSEILHEGASEEGRKNLYKLRCEGELNPRCKRFMRELLLRYNGNWKEVIDKHIRVVRQVYAEADRIGIGTFQPKDEKNQDATELTGDINYRQLAYFGSDSDPRAFNFDGEFCAGNRGMTEFIEVLKLEPEFLYDLLGASQEQQIKPKKFPQISIDTVLLSHTNEHEFQKMRNNPAMEALRDRTIKIDVPYLTRWSGELKILEHYYGPGKVRQHIAPHTLEIAALWAVLTRLQDDKENRITLIEKAKLYDGRSLPGWTEDGVKELKDKYPNEGMSGGVSCRYVQDKISNCLSKKFDYVNMFMVMNEIKEGLEDHPLFSNKEDIARYKTCVELAIRELDEILKNEVRKALVSDENAIVRLCSNYIDNLMAYIEERKIVHPITGKLQSADEKFMRSIEEKIDVPEQGVRQFRESIASFMGSLAHSGKKFTYNSNIRLATALEKKLFEDTKDHIKLSALNVSGAAVVDPEIQEKIDAIKQRLIRQYGYNEQSATDVLDYVGGIFARGDEEE